MKAKYYIYRNLNRGKSFSVKHKGIVIWRGERIFADQVHFKVSQKGRLRCIEENKRNVHAYAVCDTFNSYDTNWIQRQPFVKVTYNPYKQTHFECEGKPITYSPYVYFEDGNCFIFKPRTV